MSPEGGWAKRSSPHLAGANLREYPAKPWRTLFLLPDAPPRPFVSRAGLRRARHVPSASAAALSPSPGGAPCTWRSRRRPGPRSPPSRRALREETDSSLPARLRASRPQETTSGRAVPAGWLMPKPARDGGWHFYTARGADGMPGSRGQQRGPPYTLGSAVPT